MKTPAVPPNAPSNVPPQVPVYELASTPSESSARCHVLMIDNYDSFTFNLVQYFAELGARVEVHRNDEISLEQIRPVSYTHLTLPTKRIV